MKGKHAVSELKRAERILLSLEGCSIFHIYAPDDEFWAWYRNISGYLGKDSFDITFRKAKSSKRTVVHISFTTDEAALEVIVDAYKEADIKCDVEWQTEHTIYESHSLEDS